MTYLKKTVLGSYRQLFHDAKRLTSKVFIYAGVALSLSTLPSLGQDLTIYTERQTDLIAPVLEAFTKETGITPQVAFFKQGMLERLQNEGKNSPADVLLTVDIANLIALANGNVVAPVADGTINANIPEQYRDPDGKWFGLTMRARVLYTSKEAVPETSIDYEDLADEKYRGRICMRNGQHNYNVALIASMIAHHGEADAKKWLEGLRDNLVSAPDGNDRAQAKAIFSGACDIGIGNSYYVGLMKNNEKSPEQKDWYQAINVVFPNSDNRGTHVNLSGMALAKNAPHKENALKLMQFLSSAEAQSIYAEKVYEYPLKEGAKISDDVLSFGTLKPDALALTEIAKWRSRASELVDETGLNYGPQ